MLDPIILGHNQFFGVNHLDAQAGDQRAAQFNDVANILDIVRFAFDNDVKALMMSTHERAVGVANAIVNDSSLKDELGVYLLAPYIAKYIKQANEKGLVNIVRDSLAETSLKEKMGLFLRGGKGLLTKDVRTMIRLLIDFEVAPFKKLNLKAIFLHDAITDLALGWGMTDAFEIFYHHVQDKYGTTPAFCTKNLPKLMELFKKTSIKNPLIMASINKVGYQVGPSLDGFVKCLEENELQLLAMSTLAAGYTRPKEAYEYLFTLPRIDSVVVGTSKKVHAKETFAEIRKNMAIRDGVSAS
ncbi:hypothetical protein KAR48_07945 [bacterium]|nr:hypothetical protein [bacterium]